MDKPKDDDSLENIDIINFSTKIRSRLHRNEIVNWLRTHAASNTKKKYLFYPAELKKNIEIN